MRLNVTWPEFQALHELGREAERAGCGNAYRQAYEGLDERALALVDAIPDRIPFDEEVWLRGIEGLFGRDVYEELMRGPKPVEVRAHRSIDGLPRVQA